MGELSRQGQTVMQATGSQSFTSRLRKVAGARTPRVQKMFWYFNGFMNVEPIDLDCLIPDEGHGSGRRPAPASRARTCAPGGRRSTRYITITFEDR